MKKTFLASLLLLTIFFCLGAVLVYAQGGGGGGGVGGGGGGSPGIPIKIENPFKVGDTLYDLVEAIVNKIILPVGGVLCVLAFIYSGFLFVTAQGNETKLGTAKKALLYSAIGTAVLLGSWMIANVIRTTVNQVIN